MSEMTESAVFYGSPAAAAELEDLVEDGDFYEADMAMGDTDCPQGCRTDPDGRCPHGYESAALTLGVI